MLIPMDKDSEQRSHKRIYRHFIASFQIRPEESQKANSTKWEVVTLNDLSAGGALFNFDKEIEVGSFLDVVINFILLQHPLECQAKVLRVQKMQDSPLYRVAVIFTKIDENDKNILTNFAERFKKK